jgi:hypothetical protein
LPSTKPTSPIVTLLRGLKVYKIKQISLLKCATLMDYSNLFTSFIMVIIIMSSFNFS